MAGYSSTPLPRKLGIKPGSRVALVNAPAEFDAALGALPPDVRVSHSARGRADVAMLFATRRAQIERRFDALARAVRPAGALWIAWPKRASSVPTDLSGDVVRATGLSHGLVDNKICAVDETWSALRFVYRLRDRA